MTSARGSLPRLPLPTAAELRQRAERRLAEAPSDGEVSLAQALRLMHELQVHQIELQLQNEALQQSELEARDALQRLDELHAQLEQRVQERTVELVSARQAADVANQAKGAFLSNMSHELRTPLNGVMGMIGLALGRATDARQIDWLRKANRSAAHLLSVINDVLDLSKIEADKLTLVSSCFRLADVLSLVSDMLSPLAAEKGLAFDVDMAPDLAQYTVQGDAQRLGQVLLNLAGNAVKFTDAGRVHIALSLAEVHDHAIVVRFEVLDTGAGIAPADLGRLFHEFEQVDDSPTRRQGGTGLGLAICKHMVRLMKGEIGVDSSPGLGSRFWFTARLALADAGAPGASRPPVRDVRSQLRQEFAGLKVLLAEDNAINQQVVVALLEAVGLSVDVAASGPAAVERAQHADHALILMDLQMPILDGIGATLAIRAMPACAHTPIVAFTASAFDQDRERCLAAGMDDHLAKPVDPDRLYETVLRWLRARRMVPPS